MSAIFEVLRCVVETPTFRRHVCGQGEGTPTLLGGGAMLLNDIETWGAYSFKPSAGIAGKCTQIFYKSLLYMFRRLTLCCCCTQNVHYKAVLNVLNVSSNRVELGQEIYFT